MSKLSSRVYLATEAIVICLPLTVSFVVAVIPAQIDHSVNLSEPDFVDLASGLVTLAGLVCLWRLMAAFLVGGRTGLRRLSTYWWVLPIAGAALAVHIAAGSWDTTVQVRQATTGSKLFTYAGHSGPVYAVAWGPLSPDGSMRLASASGDPLNADIDNTVQIWDASTGENPFIYRKHYYYVQAAAWSPDPQDDQSRAHR